MNSGTGTAATLSLGNVHAGAFSRAVDIKFGDGGAGPQIRGSIMYSGLGNIALNSVTGGVDFTVANNGLATRTLNFTTAAGLLSGNITFANNFDDVTDTQVLISGAAYRLAAGTPSLDPVSLGNYRVGDVAQQALSLTNTATNDGYSEKLDASLGGATGDATASGSFSLLASGNTNNTALVVGVGTLTAGHKSGTATVSRTSNGTGTSGLGTTALASQMVNVTGDVYRYAASDLLTASLDFGVVHVGDSVAARTVGVSNSAAGDGYSDNLRASLGTVVGSGILPSGGPVSVAGGASDSSMRIGIDTSSAGSRSGTVAVDFHSNPTASGLTGKDLDPGNVAISGRVNEYAVASMLKASGDGTFSGGGPEYLLDLGTIDREAGMLTATLAILNDVVGSADWLDGSFTCDPGSFAITGTDDFTMLQAGQAQDGVCLSLSSALDVGVYTGSLVLHPVGKNGGGYQGSLSDVTVNFVGEVVPEPMTSLLLALGGLAGLRRRWCRGFGQ